MHILFIFGSNGKINTLNAISSPTINRLVQGLHAQQTKITIITNFSNDIRDLGKDISVEGIQVYNMPFLGDHHSMYPYDSEAYTTAFDALFKKINADIIQIYALEYYRGSLIHALQKTSGKVIYVATDFITVCSRYNLLKGNTEICRTGPVSLQTCMQCQTKDASVSKAFFKKMLRLVPDKIIIDLLHKRKNTGLVKSIARQNIYTRQSYINQKQFINRADYLVAPSNKTIDLLKSYGWGNKKSSVITWGLNTVTQTGELQTPNAVCTIAFSGRYVEEKGLHVLLKVLNIIHSKGINFRLIIFGKDFFAHPGNSYVEELKKYGEPIKEKIEFRSYNGNSIDDIAAAMRSIDVLVVPSIWYDNTPLVALEALTNNRKILIPRHSSMAELTEANSIRYNKDEETGPDSLVQVLLHTIQNKNLMYDITHAYRWSQADELQKYMRLYQEVLSEN